MAFTQEQIAELYVATFDRAPDLAGLNYWMNDTSATTLDEVANAMIASDEMTAKYSADQTTEEFVAAVYENLFDRAPDAAGLDYWVEEINSGSVPKESMILAVINGALGDDATMLEEATQAAMDSIAAEEAAEAEAASSDVVHYYRDGITNSDTVDGTAATHDVVKLMLDAGETAVSPVFNNIDVLEVRTQATTTSTGDNQVDTDLNSDEDNGIDARETNIDAQDMGNTSEFWSVDSRADLVIEDVRHNSVDTVIGLRDSDSGDVDYSVYFNNQDINDLGSANQGGGFVIKAADYETLSSAATINSTADLVQDFVSTYSTFSFDYTTSGTTKSIQVKLDDTENIKSYEDLANAIDNALKGTDAGEYLEAVVSGSWVGSDQNSNLYTIPLIVINNVSNQNITFGTFGWKLDTDTDGETNYGTYIGDMDASNIPSLTQTDLVLDNAGRGCKTGDVEVGSMSTDGCSGIQQFNLSVDRDSWIDSLSSTNNTLEVINVVNIDENSSETEGALRIDDIQDVRVFDASAMVNGATITADLSADVTAKYLDLQDTAYNAAADNSEINLLSVTDTQFSYDFGSANDTLNLTISSANLEAAGATSREDFVLEINGNNGDDTINTAIGDADDATNWYINSKINANMTVNGGTGDDTITTTGAGDMIINGDSGDDTIYANNNGDKASFVFNAVNHDLTDLQSQESASLSAVNAQLTVTYKGITTDISEIANSYGLTTNATITDLSVNQAIKDAILADDVLNKLITVNDGPANTLVVTSLIDGDVQADELSINFSTAALTDSQAAAGVTAFTVGNTVTDGYVTTLAAAGSAATGSSDNTITGGTGNDVIVLGTDDQSNDTVVFSGNFGNDTVVNFSEDGADIDTLDFSAYNTASTANYITVAAENTDNDTTSEVSALYAADAKTYVYIAYDADDIGTVYSISNGSATSRGTIHLGDDNDNNDTAAGFTSWANLTADNFTAATFTAAAAPAASGSTTTVSATGVNTYTHDMTGDDTTTNDNIIDFPTDNISISNTDLSDGEVVLSWNDGTVSNTATVTLTGLTSAQDADAYSVAQIDAIFGAGTIA